MCIRDRYMGIKLKKMFKSIFGCCISKGQEREIVSIEEEKKMKDMKGAEEHKRGEDYKKSSSKTSDNVHSNRAKKQNDIVFTKSESKHENVNQNNEEEKKGEYVLSLIHISEPTRPLYISYAVFCLKKKKKKKINSHQITKTINLKYTNTPTI
eukprot:TRINITY_DN31169_c0_g1_i1.p1 TRINITY_DN31169_c0_g1~~TRINITY_DN31169_c0_g1_i1.p1  ORF type:complete len:153 (-),score=38.21 TRINITY_DN31169_c0_g1_i1:32-490(-)